MALSIGIRFWKAVWQCLLRVITFATFEPITAFMEIILESNPKTENKYIVMTVKEKVVANTTSLNYAMEIMLQLKIMIINTM